MKAANLAIAYGEVANLDTVAAEEVRVIGVVL